MRFRFRALGYIAQGLRLSDQGLLGFSVQGLEFRV
jgi:hypothetical protein